MLLLQSPSVKVSYWNEETKPQHRMQFEVLVLEPGNLSFFVCIFLMAALVSLALAKDARHRRMEA